MNLDNTAQQTMVQYALVVLVIVALIGSWMAYMKAGGGVSEEVNQKLDEISSSLDDIKSQLQPSPGEQEEEEEEEEEEESMEERISKLPVKSFHYRTASGASITHATATAFADILKRYDSKTRLSPETSRGSARNPVLVNSGMGEAYSTNLVTHKWCLNEEAIYENISFNFTPKQAMGMFTVDWFFVIREGTAPDAEYIRDLPEGTKVGPSVSGDPNTTMLVNLLELAGVRDKVNVIYLEHGSMAGAMAEKRVDVVGCYSLFAKKIGAGWQEDLFGRNDLKVLKIHPETAEKYEGPFVYTEVDNPYKDIEEDTFHAMSSVYCSFWPERVDPGYVYDFLDKIYEASEKENLTRYHEAMAIVDSGPQACYDLLLPKLGIHEGAKKWYEDHDIS